MNMSEDKAKEILDFLIAYKVNSQAKWMLEPFSAFSSNYYILRIELDVPGIKHVGFAKNIDNRRLYACHKPSYKDMLEVLIDGACTNDVVCPLINEQYDYVIIPHMTSLEQILLEMDLEKTLLAGDKHELVRTTS